MSWTLLVGLVLLLGLSLLAAISRRAELRRMASSVAERERITRAGNDAQLHQPLIDLSRCLGCGKCVEVCPEKGVLELVHGQAVVVNGARCQGIAACERECPVGAIVVTLANVETRTDIPALTEEMEAVGSPGLFLAGEVTAHTLIRTAVTHGVAVATEVARRLAGANGSGHDGDLDLVIVGAGPAGLACSLEAQRLGLRFVTLEQEPELGGTVAKYPRRKLVLTEPVEMPLHGLLEEHEYTKEELIDLWKRIAAEHGLSIAHGQVFREVERGPEGTWVVVTDTDRFAAPYVCLALGRRGVPNKLGVPGEELPKVAYSLLDASSYQGRRILVVGGGDSAVETAVGLAEQPGNEVTLSYRREGFFRIRAKNQERIEACIAQRRVKVVFRSQVTAIHHDAVEFDVETTRGVESLRLANDDVFVMAGGMAPVEPLQRAGVSFDPSLRKPAATLVEQGTGLVRALTIGFGLAVATLVWAAWHFDYYGLALGARPAHDKHAVLRSGLGIGLWLGIAAFALIIVNLLYLVRRSPRWKLRWGSLQAWMTSHVATGILAFLFTLLHAGMAPRDTPGGHAFWALLVLLVTGAIGRYFYAWVPRAANGRELELAEVKARLSNMDAEWDQGQRRFREKARQQVLALVEARQWRGSFMGRVLALLGVRRDLSGLVSRLVREGRSEGIPEQQIRDTVRLARRAHHAVLATAHYEDVRALLNTWRWLHRWVAVLMVVLVIVHIVHALTYGMFLAEGPA